MIVRSMRFLLTVFMQSRLLRGMFHAEDIFLWSAAVPPSRELSDIEKVVSGSGGRALQ